MAMFGRKQGIVMATNFMKSLIIQRPSTLPSNTRCLSDAVSSEVITSHTAKWMQLDFGI
ncbi:Hypothetical predicted protein [Olea europaea subsp. europaea]|uniref:Uncharacterized protein n=1 Tax=Olea europaea subsp. europaea TaxID=158383 RepID=A0A8S0TLI3_OLEEU|nr:Hypothetical predicted protein [Olea europaea subsp. europaea]